MKLKISSTDIIEAYNKRLKELDECERLNPFYSGFLEGAFWALGEYDKQSKGKINETNNI